MKKIFLFIIGFALVTSCRDKGEDDPVTPAQDQLRMTVQPTFGVDDLVLDQTYTTDEGYNVQFTDLKCYMTDIRNGSSILCSSALFDYREKGTTQ